MKREIQNIMANEKLVNEALKIALGEINATEAIKKFLENLGPSVEGDRVYIFEGLRDTPVNNGAPMAFLQKRIFYKTYLLKR